jgi:hypothetical protein
MPQTAKTKAFESGDVFIRDDLSREYNAESVNVANAGSTHVFYPPGTPFTGAAQTIADVTAGGTGSLTGTDQMVLEGVYVPPGGGKVAMLKRPVGVVINVNAVPIVINGVSYTAGGLQAMWTRLGFVYRFEPTRWDEQTR